MNLEDLRKRYAISLNIRRYAPRTKQIYTYKLESFLAYGGFTDSSEITIFSAQDYLNYLLLDENIKSVRTHNQSVYALRQLFEAVLHIPITPRQLPKLRPEKTPEKPWFTAEQSIQLIDKCPNLRLKAAIALCVCCGLRITELTTLKFRHVNKTSHILTIENSKGNKTRYVPYPSSVQEILNLYCTSCLKRSQIRPDGYIFPDTKKPESHIKNSTLSKEFITYVQAFPFTLPNHTIHSLRHSFATELAMKNVPLPVIQKMMGHTSAATTAVYIHMPADNLSLPHIDLLDKKEDEDANCQATNT